MTSLFKTGKCHLYVSDNPHCFWPLSSLSLFLETKTKYPIHPLSRGPALMYRHFFSAPLSLFRLTAHMQFPRTNSPALWNVCPNRTRRQWLVIILFNNYLSSTHFVPDTSLLSVLDTQHWERIKRPCLLGTHLCEWCGDGHTNSHMLCNNVTES